MNMLVQLRKDHPDDTVLYNGIEFQKGLWYYTRGTIHDYPRLLFRVKKRIVDLGSKCPDCGEGKIEFAFGESDLDFLWCELCGALDEDHWWETIKLSIRWKG